MGREIRRVPPNWEHPKYTAEDHSHRIGQYRPMFDDHFDATFVKWLADFDRIRSGDFTDIERECYPRGLADWLVDEGAPPDPNYYRPYKDEEATWFQVYETVSEGTPVTPPFATKEELIDYLAANGDFWDQSRGDPPWKRKAAESFVKLEWAPSMMAVSSEAGVKIFEARDGFPED